MNQRPLSVLFFFLLIIAVSSCSDSGTAVVGNKTVEILPLAIGNQWIYSVQPYDVNGSFYSPWEGGRTVLADTMIDGEKWFTWDSTDVRHFWINHSDGFYLYPATWSDGSSIKKTKQLYYKYPGTVGDAPPYLRTKYTDHSSYDTYEIVSTDSLFTTPAGDFHCYVYEFYSYSEDSATHTKTKEASKYKYFYFYAPGVGLVGWDNYATNPTTKEFYLSEHTVLKKYTLVK
jgi:hypothetical protein